MLLKLFPSRVIGRLIAIAAMIIIMAAVVGSIAFSMMMPLLKINEFIGG